MKHGLHRGNCGRWCAPLLLAHLAATSFAAPTKDIDAQLGMTRLGAKENNTYFHLGLSKKLNAGYRSELLATFGPRKTYNGNGFTVRYGGSDAEFRFHCEKDAKIQGYLGAAYAGTPAGKDRMNVVAGAKLSLKQTENSGLDVVARSVSGSKSTLLGVGLSAHWKAPTYGLRAEVLAVTGAPNSLSEKTGAKQRRLVYRLGVNRALQDGTVLELGVTNQMGRTTGTSLTPGLGKGMGLYLEAKVKL